jgi:hypothetical protein
MGNIRAFVMEFKLDNYDCVFEEAMCPECNGIDIDFSFQVNFQVSRKKDRLKIFPFLSRVTLWYKKCIEMFVWEPESKKLQLEKLNKCLSDTFGLNELYVADIEEFGEKLGGLSHHTLIKDVTSLENRLPRTFKFKLNEPQMKGDKAYVVKVGQKVKSKKK